MNSRSGKKAVILVLAIWSLIVLTNGWSATQSAVTAQEIESAAVTTPHSVLYQGYVTLGGEPYDGAGSFKFAITNQQATTTYWSNDGTSGVPSASVHIDVHEGYFTVRLGNTSLSGMSESLPPGVFQAPGRYLKVWFASSTSGPFTGLNPVPIASAPYALNAETLDGSDSSAFQARVGGDCEAGQSIRAVHADGSVVCEPDDDTTYSPGNQLQLSGTTFHVTEGAGSGLNADLLDGQQGNYYLSASNLNAGTLQTDRYSAYADLSAEGYLGNAAGDLARNNGTLQAGLNADRVDNYQAEQLASTAAYAGGDQNLALSSNAAVVRSVTITAPSSGVVIVNASGYGDFQSQDGVIRCSITTGTSIDFNHLTLARGTYYTSIATTRGYTVSRGTYTFRLVCDEYSGNLTIGDSNITAVFSPGAFAGTSTMEESPSTLQDTDSCADADEPTCGP